MKSLVIIDYGSGNLHSVQQSAKKVLNEHSKEWQVISSSRPADVAKADHIILPGVGHFQDCKNNLSKIQDMEEVLEKRVQNDAIAFLGICVGMQLMASKGFEGNPITGLNWISGRVESLKPEPEGNLKIPHIKKKKTKCEICKKKSLILFNCKCGLHTCMKHKYPDMHNCTYDFKSENVLGEKCEFSKLNKINE